MLAGVRLVLGGSSRDLLLTVLVTADCVWISLQLYSGNTLLVLDRASCSVAWEILGPSLVA